jgi:Nucleotidyltransferase domain
MRRAGKRVAMGAADTYPAKPDRPLRAIDRTTHLAFNHLNARNRSIGSSVVQSLDTAPACFATQTYQLLARPISCKLDFAVVNIAFPHSSVAPTLEGDVLVVLAGTTRALTGREVGRLARRGSPPAVAAALNRLVRQGLVLRDEIGGAFLHTLNRDHLAAPAVLVLAGLRTELLDRLRAEVTAWEVEPVSVVLFGSAARGDGDADSDIDILVVRSADVDGEDARWRGQLDRVTGAVHAWTGNHASLIEVSEGELPGLLDANAPVLESVRADGIPLAGTPPDRLFREREPA